MHEWLVTIMPNGPEYSIIVPTYRRPDPLRRCLEAIGSIEFPRNRFEVIVVDDGSAQPPADVVAPFGATLDVQMLCASHGGPAHARNIGARHARGHVLVFTDDDCVPSRDWLSAIDRAITASREPVAIGGRVINVLDEDVFAAASQGIVDFLYDYYREHPAPWRFFTSNNIALPRAEFIEIGGFDEGFERAAAEDRDLCERWRGAGFDLQYEPHAVVGHAHKLGFARFNRQHFAYGRGAFDLHRSRARRGSRSLRLEPVRFYLGLVGYPLRRSSAPRSVLLSALHAWSQVAYVSGYFFERLRRGWVVDSGRDDRNGPADGHAPGDATDSSHGSMSGAA
jgi:glycosyltransferase involved in cell wall biosynthesis